MKGKNYREIIGKYSFIAEITAAVVAVMFLIYFLRSMLLSGETTLMHDSIHGYPYFQYFVENIINVGWPFWNPFSHGGEPFYFMIEHRRLLEPISLLTIYLAQFITNDVVLILGWNTFILSIAMVTGIYILLRSFADNLFIRLTLIPILLYSSIFLGSFRQASLLLLFMWVPYIAYFLLRIIWHKDCRWHNWLILGCLIGLNWQSYYFVGVCVFLLFFAIGFILFQRNLLIELFKTKSVLPKFIVAAVIVLFMMAPNIVILLEKDRLVFPARMIDSSSMEGVPQGGPQQYETRTSDMGENIIMPYSIISRTGTVSTIWDFIQLISPGGSPVTKWTDMKSWGSPSEAYMYLGILPWAIAILGMIMGRHGLKRVWLLIFFAFGLLMLGAPGGLHKALYYVFPPIWFVRHTHLFVLFFVFALLYFYVLGFNYIFSIWHKPLFTSDAKKRTLNCSLVIIAFSACTVASVYWMTRLEYPQTDYLFVCFILVFVVGWFLRKSLGEKGLYTSIIISHIAIVVILTTNTFRFSIYTLLTFGIPLLFFLLYMQIRTGLSDKAKHVATIILFFVFAVSVIGDLVYSFKQSEVFYHSQLHPGLAYNINTKIQKPSFPQKRLITPNSLPCTTGQSMRMASLAYRQSYVFSPLYPGYEYPEIDNFEILTKTDFDALNNSSFESWIKMQDGSLLPEHSIYHQDGYGGTVERYALEDGVRNGKYSVLLKPSSTGNSFLRFQTKNIDELKGPSVIRFSVWVKSQNKTPDAVQVDIQDGTSAPSLKSYKNSGNWERVEVLKYIDENALELFVTCNVKHNATAGAYFDGIAIEVASVNPFVYALNSKRWNSLLLPKKYFELIHSDIPPLAINDMFAVGKPVFQFKHGAVAAEDDEAINLLKRMGSKESVQLLEDYVIVDSQINPSASKLIIPAREYGKRSKAVSSTGEKSRFTFSISRYDYNNFDMRVSTDKDGILYWADGYDTWWEAYINGKEVPIYKANINFKAIALPKGENQIRFVYKPVLFIISLFVFYGSLIMSSVAALATFINCREG